MLELALGGESHFRILEQRFTAFLEKWRVPKRRRIEYLENESDARRRVHLLLAYTTKFLHNHELYNDLLTDTPLQLLGILERTILANILVQRKSLSTTLVQPDPKQYPAHALDVALTYTLDGKSYCYSLNGGVAYNKYKTLRTNEILHLLHRHRKLPPSS